VIRTVGHPERKVASIPYPRMRSHQVVIGTTGTGKTTLVFRLNTVLTGHNFSLQFNPLRLLAGSACQPCGHAG
jgi:hypothetical protein